MAILVFAHTRVQYEVDLERVVPRENFIFVRSERDVYGCDIEGIIYLQDWQRAGRDVINASVVAEHRVKRQQEQQAFIDSRKREDPPKFSCEHGRVSVNIVDAICAKSVPFGGVDGLTEFCGNQHNPNWRWDRDTLNEMSYDQLAVIWEKLNDV